jgi:hypothetical protein
MRRQAEIALWTYLIPLASTRAFRIGLLIVVLFLGMVGLSVLLRSISDVFASFSFRGLREWVIVPGVPLLAILFSEIPIRDGIRQRTLLYPLLGPVSRNMLALVRTGATAVMLAAGASLAVILVRLLHGSGLSPLPGELLAIWLAAAVYIPLFGVFHLITRRGLIAGLGFYAMLDAPMARLPFELRNVSPSFHVRVLADQVIEIEGLPIPIQAPETSMLVSVIVLLIIAAVFLGLGGFLFGRKDLGEIC